MSAKEKSRRGRGCRRVLLWMLLVPIMLVVLVVGLLGTGIPQREALQRLFASQLKADVHVGGVTLRNPLVIHSLALTDQAARLYAPLVRVDSIATQYRWEPDAPRHIPSMELDGVQLSLRGGGSGNNYQFLYDLLTAPANPDLDVAPWIPENVRVNDLWAEIQYPGYEVRMDNLAAAARLYGLEAGHLSFGAEELAIAWRSELMPGGPQSHVGRLKLELDWKGADVAVSTEMDFGRLAQLEGQLALSTRDGAPYLDVTVPVAVLDDPLWSAILVEHLPTPIRFDTLSLSDVRLGLHALESGLRVDAAELDGTVSRVSIGPDAAPYYEGPLQMALHGSYGDSTSVEGQLTLEEGLALNGQVTVADDGVTGTVELPPWPKGVIQALLPEAYRGAFDVLAPLNGLGGTVSVVQAPDLLDVTATLDARFADDTLEIPLALQLTATPEGEALTVDTELTLNKATVKTTVSGMLGSALKTKNTLSDVVVNAWTEGLLGKEMVPGLSGALTGQVDVEVPPEGPLDIDVALTGMGLGYDTLVLPGDGPTTISGRMNYNLETGHVRGKKLHFAQESVIDLVANDWQMGTDSMKVVAAAETHLSLDAVATLFELASLYGNADIAGGIQIDDKAFILSGFTASSSDLGYTDDWSVPYGSTLTLDGNLAYDYDARRLSFTPGNARIDEGTMLQMEAFHMDMPTDTSPFRMTATPLVLQSDLELLKSFGAITAVREGRATLSSEKLTFSEGDFGGQTRWDIAAEFLALPDEMAELNGLVTTGTYNPGNEEDGKGKVAATSATIYGMPFGAVETGLRLDPTQLYCEGLETTFLGGTVKLDGTLDYRDPAWKTKADLRVARIDLKEFTKTFEPPDVVLTGIVGGTVTMTVSTEGLEALDVDMEATEGLTLNRSMVRQILMSQYVNDAVGNKSVQKIIEKVIGEDEQRPFDRAILELGMEDGLIVGIARLESKSLDVTVDISAQPSAILEAIRSSTE